MHIRQIDLDDAEKLVNLILQVESESDFMLFEAGERKLTPEQQRNRIVAMEEEENSTIFVAGSGRRPHWLLDRHWRRGKTEPTFGLPCGRNIEIILGERRRHPIIFGIRKLGKKTSHSPFRINRDDEQPGSDRLVQQNGV